MITWFQVWMFAKIGIDKRIHMFVNVWCDFWSTQTIVANNGIVY